MAASLETLLAKTEPAEYGRLATGLIFDGKVQLQGGQELKLSRSEFGREDDGRPLAQQLIQGSLRDYALGLPPDPPDAAIAGTDAEIGRGRYHKKAVYGEGTFGPALPKAPASSAGLGEGSGHVGDGSGDEAEDSREDRFAVRPLSFVAGARPRLPDSDGNVHLADSGAGRHLSVPLEEFENDLTSIIVPSSFVRQAAQKLDAKAKAVAAGMDPETWMGQMMQSVGRRPRKTELRRIWVRQLRALDALLRFRRVMAPRAAQFLEGRLRSLARGLAHLDD